MTHARTMKAYVVTSGIVFLLVVLAHIARLISEGVHLLVQPTFALTSVLSTALTIWAWRLFSRLSRNKRS